MKVAHKRYLENCAKRGVAPVTSQAVPTAVRPTAGTVHTAAVLTSGDSGTATSAGMAVGSEQLAALNAAVVTTSTATATSKECCESVVQHSDAVVTALNAALANNGGKGKVERSVVEGVLQLAEAAAQRAGAANIAAERAVTRVEELRSVLTECVGDGTSTTSTEVQPSGGTRVNDAASVSDALTADASAAHVSVPELRASIHDDSRTVGCVPSVGAPHGTSSAAHGNSVETASETGTGDGVKQVVGREPKGQGKKQTRQMKLSPPVRRGIVLMMWGVLTNTATCCIAHFDQWRLQQSCLCGLDSVECSAALHYLHNTTRLFVATGGVSGHHRGAPSDRNAGQHPRRAANRSGRVLAKKHL
jgi:hypothetical protein